VVAIDWPGHGHSSHRPIGSHYSSYDYIADIKYVVDGEYCILLLQAYFECFPASLSLASLTVLLRGTP